jgi:hypothetical protein
MGLRLADKATRFGSTVPEGSLLCVTVGVRLDHRVAVNSPN